MLRAAHLLCRLLRASLPRLLAVPTMVSHHHTINNNNTLLLLMHLRRLVLLVLQQDLKAPLTLTATETLIIHLKAVKINVDVARMPMTLTDTKIVMNTVNITPIALDLANKTLDTMEAAANHLAAAGSMKVAEMAENQEMEAAALIHPLALPLRATSVTIINSTIITSLLLHHLATLLEAALALVKILEVDTSLVTLNLHLAIAIPLKEIVMVLVTTIEDLATTTTEDPARRTITTINEEKRPFVAHLQVIAPMTLILHSQACKYARSTS